MLADNYWPSFLNSNRITATAWVILLMVMAPAIGMGCDSSSDRRRSRDYDVTPPSPPIQEPVLRDYSGEEEEALDSLRELNELKDSIVMDLKSWKRARRTKAGPSFIGEADKLREKIIEKCDDLEGTASSLLRANALQSVANGPSELRSFVRFAKETRVTVRDANDE